MMTAGSVIGSLTVAGIAVASSYAWFLAAWLIAGVASAGLFYPPAFAALTGWYGPRRVQALTTLTLAGGSPARSSRRYTGTGGRLGWRGTYLVLAAVLAAVTIPAHSLGLRLPGPTRPRVRPRWDTALSPSASQPAIPAARHGRDAVRVRPYAALVNLVPLLMAGVCLLGWRRGARARRRRAGRRAALLPRAGFPAWRPGPDCRDHRRGRGGRAAPRPAARPGSAAGGRLGAAGASRRIHPHRGDAGADYWGPSRSRPSTACSIPR